MLAGASRGGHQWRCRLPQPLPARATCPPRRRAPRSHGARTLRARRARLATVVFGRRRPVTVHLLIPEAGGAGDHRGPLSPRQHEVLRLLAAGKVAKQIAVELGISEATVRNHIRDTHRRLGAHSQLEAVAIARRRGLVP